MDHWLNKHSWLTRAAADSSSGLSSGGSLLVSFLTTLTKHKTCHIPNGAVKVQKDSKLKTKGICPLMAYSPVFHSINPQRRTETTLIGEEHTWCWRGPVCRHYPGWPNHGPDLLRRAVQGRWEPGPSVWIEGPHSKELQGNPSSVSSAADAQLPHHATWWYTWGEKKKQIINCKWIFILHSSRVYDGILVTDVGLLSNIWLAGQRNSWVSVQC